MVRIRGRRNGVRQAEWKGVNRKYGEKKKDHAEGRDDEGIFEQIL